MIGSSSSVLTSQSDLTIDGEHFRDVDYGIWLLSCNRITIRNCTFDAYGKGIYLQHCTEVLIEDCTFGTATRLGTGGISADAIQVDQSDTVTVQDCTVWHTGPTTVEDSINVYKSDNVTIQRCKVRGGNSTTGAGIILGDNGGSNLIAQDNLCINTGNVGIGASGGSNLIVQRNTVINTGSLVSNVGVYSWGWAGQISNVEVSSNVVSWRRADGSVHGWYDAGDAGAIVGVGSNNFAATLDESVWSTWTP